MFEHNIPVINQFLNGYSVSILAYGMTSSGKTYTLQRSDGLIPHILNYLFV
ncbi:MAG: hypothetical protein SR1Q7_05655 [Quinella sp. 1Q7]|nr:hypothetical protein [Quinella sp. 1Q7]